MKNQLFLATTIIAFFLFGCKKSSNNPNTNNGQGSMSLTYTGKTITFDSAYNGAVPWNTTKRIIGKNGIFTISGSGTYCYFDFDNLSIGKHTLIINQGFDVGLFFFDNSIYKSIDLTDYTYTITSNTNNKVSGYFAFRTSISNPLDSARGTFKDISI